MSVILTGYKMPKSCSECFLSDYKSEIDMGATIEYFVNCKGKIDYKGRPHDCPLVEVKEEKDGGMDEFILHWLADVYGSPCEYDFAGIDTSEYLEEHDPDYCEQHCGQTDYECWKKFLETKYKEAMNDRPKGNDNKAV